MRATTKRLLAGLSAGTAAGLWVAYGLMIRPRHLRWGATDGEIAARMPFDELIPQPNYFATRAITIAARPEEVWPFVTDPELLPLGTRVRHTEPRRLVVFTPPEKQAEVTWVVTLEPRPDGTRLVSRNRARFHPTIAGVMRYLAVDPGQFVFERDWMLAVKRHAEHLAVPTPQEAQPTLA
jgi:hypothetical protein